MPKRTILLICAVALAAGATSLASDRTAVYAKIERVVLEPNSQAPDRIQVWGVFSIADPVTPSAYKPAAKGYLYLAASGDAATARKEWADLETVAGTGQIVAFGSRFETIPRVRQAADKPSGPDAYATDTGVIKVQGKTDYAPIRALVDFRQ